MNDRPGFALHPEAAQDTLDIWEYIAAANFQAAQEFRERILVTVRSLAIFSHQGQRRPDLTVLPLRFRVMDDYIIVYAPDERPLLVVAVLHGRRHPRVMAAIVRGRT